VRAETRRQLKQDRFATTVAQEVAWAGEHRKQLTIAGVVIAIVVAAGLGLWYWNNRQDIAAAAKLGEAQTIYRAPIVPAGTPSTPDNPTFSSAAERAKTALKLFAAIADQYSHTNSGKLARYYTGLCYRDMGDYNNAEAALKKTADSGDKDLAALSKFALGELYASQNRLNDAAAQYKDLAAHPAGTVSRTTALLQMAQMYENRKQLPQARDAYQEIVKDNAKSQAGAFAQTKVNELNVQLGVPQQPQSPPLQR
jgi:TolA-binding protein